MAQPSERMIQNSPFEIGIAELVTYTLTVPSAWGSSPTSPTVTVLDKMGVTITAAVSGTPSVSASVITFALDGSEMTRDDDYRVTVQWTDSGSTLNCWGMWQCRQ